MVRKLHVKRSCTRQLAFRFRQLQFNQLVCRLFPGFNAARMALQTATAHRTPIAPLKPAPPPLRLFRAVASPDPYSPQHSSTHTHTLTPPQTPTPVDLSSLPAVQELMEASPALTPITALSLLLSQRVTLPHPPDEATAKAVFAMVAQAEDPQLAQDAAAACLEWWGAPMLAAGGGLAPCGFGFWCQSSSCCPTSLTISFTPAFRPAYVCSKCVHIPVRNCTQPDTSQLSLNPLPTHVCTSSN